MGNYLDLAGAMIWSIDTDDHRGDYAAQRFPMLHTIHDTLETDEKYDPENPMCNGSAPICPDLLPTTTEPPTEPPTTMMTFPFLEIVTSTSCAWPMPMVVMTCKNSHVEIGYLTPILMLVLTLPYPQMITFAMNNLSYCNF